MYRYAPSLLALLVLLPASANAQQAEEAHIRRLFTEVFVSLWQRADAPGLAQLWHDDGDWMNLIGSRRLRRGRADLESVWQVGLRGRDTEAKRRLEVDLDAVRLLGPETAQADLVFTFGSPETGLIREALTAVLEKRDGQWRILSARVARIARD